LFCIFCIFFKVVDGAINDGFESMAKLLEMVGKEFSRSAQSRRFKLAGRKAKKEFLSQSIPVKIASQPDFLSSFVQTASGHGFFTAERLELVEYLQDKIQQCFDRGIYFFC
jgi:hypothetical protein